MAQYVGPVLFALFLWWFSTGLILWLDGLPRRTYRWSMLGASVILVVSLLALFTTRADETISGAYIAFTSGLLVWGFNEIAFLMGYATGPRTDPCRPGCKGWRHVGHAVGTILYHELAIIASAAVIAAITWDAPNQVGLWTFLVLWVMRLSSKLNVFLGVPNLTEEFLPDHLAYMKSFFRKRPMNGLFPIAVTAATALAALIVYAAATAATPFEAASYTFIAALLALAIVEHWFLVLPISIVPLWRWGLRTHVDAEPVDLARGSQTSGEHEPPAEDDPRTPENHWFSEWFEACHARLRSHEERVRAEFSR